ncbi:MAG: glycosyltransferase, partial [Anaerolineales bacterium]|nr:glycosyltransferase [Anaerolineales bacterium]
DIVVFSDANNMYAPDTIREMIKPFADPEVGATSGAKTIIKGDGALGDSEGLYWKYESYIKKQETLTGSITGVVGELFAIRRDLFASPPDKIINDDFYMAMQLIHHNYRVVYVPTARSSERVSLSAEDEVNRRSRIVAGRYQALNLLPFKRPLVVWQIVSHKLLRPLVPLAMIGAFVANVLALLLPSNSAQDHPVLRLGRPFAALFLALQVTFYALAWLGNQLSLEGKLGKLLYLPTFLVNSNRAALIGLYRMVTKRQSTLWQRAQRREESTATEDEPT